MKAKQRIGIVVVDPGAFVVERRMLLHLRRRVEGRVAPREDSCHAGA